MIRYTWQLTGGPIYIKRFVYCGANTNDPINLSKIFDSNISLVIIGKLKWCSSITTQHGWIAVYLWRYYFTVFKKEPDIFNLSSTLVLELKIFEDKLKLLTLFNKTPIKRTTINIVILKDIYKYHNRHKVDLTITELIYNSIGHTTIQLELELSICITIRELMINNFSRGLCSSPLPEPSLIVYRW